MPTMKDRAVRASSRTLHASSWFFEARLTTSNKGYYYQENTLKKWELGAEVERGADRRPGFAKPRWADKRTDEHWSTRAIASGCA
jgi:hypothetical protein